MRRDVAQANSWKIIPFHPLGKGDPQILNYDSGISSIDWVTMNEKNYTDENSKRVCMAECLAPSLVSPDKIF